jgi:hypothetical protein
MVRALNLGSGELSEIDELIRRLEDPEGGNSIVPEDFLSLWTSFAPLVSSKARRQ